MSQATLHQSAEQEVADAEQELANWQTAKNSQTIAALDLPSLPQRLSLNHGLVVDSERIVSALDLAGVDEARRMLTKSGSCLPDASIATSCIAVISTAIAKHNYYVRALLRPEGVWELVDAGRSADAPLPLQPLDYLTPPPPLPHELRDAGWSIRQSATTRLWYYHQKGVNGAWRIQKERPWCPDKWPLRRAQPFDRDPFRALPADVVGRVLENLVLDPYVRAVGHAPVNYLGVREWKNDEELVPLLAFAACSQACRRAARSDVLWRERVELLEQTYEPGPVDARLWRPRKSWMDPRRMHPAWYEKQTPFSRYRSLAFCRWHARMELWRRYLKDDEWSAEDRQLLQELADDARAEVQDTINMDAGDSERHGAEIIPWTRAQWRRDRRNCPRHGDACLGNCTVRDVARVILCHTMQELDGGVVGNVRRLIIGGFSQYVEPPEDEEWDIHFLISRCGATNPVFCEYDLYASEDEAGEG